MPLQSGENTYFTVLVDNIVCSVTETRNGWSFNFYSVCNLRKGTNF